MIRYISLYRSCVHALGIQNLSMENKAIMRILFASLSEQRKKVANFCCDDDWLFRMWQLVARSLATIKKDESLTGLGADAWHSPLCVELHFLCSWQQRKYPKACPQCIWSGKKACHQNLKIYKMKFCCSQWWQRQWQHQFRKGGSIGSTPAAVLQRSCRIREHVLGTDRIYSL